MKVDLYDEVMKPVAEGVVIADTAVPPEVVMYGTQAYIHVVGSMFRRAFVTAAQVVAMPGEAPGEPSSEDPIQL